jgi:hypothetical protein
MARIKYFPSQHQNSLGLKLRMSYSEALPCVSSIVALGFEVATGMVEKAGNLAGSWKEGKASILVLGNDLIKRGIINVIPSKVVLGYGFLS